MSADRAGVVRLAPGDPRIRDARPLVERTRSGPYRYLQRTAPRRMRRFWWQQVVERSRSREGAVFLARDGGEVTGAVGFSPLPWESGLFAERMGGIDLLLAEQTAVARELVGAVLELARREGFAFVSSRVYTDEVHLIHALQSHGFLLVDTMLEHGLDLRSAPRSSPDDPEDGPTVRRGRPGDVASAVEMIRACFDGYFGRFHSDPRIAREKADRVYVEWVRASFGDFADHVVLAADGERIVGLTVWKRLRPLQPHGIEAANYSLSAVHPEQAGRGLATRLSLHGLELMRAEGVRFVEALTHINNLGIERALRASGFKIVDGRHTFHRWLDGNGAAPGRDRG